MDQYSEPSPEQNQENTLFGFGIDQISKTHLWEASKWARFLAIVGFIMCGLVAIAGIFAGSYFATSDSYDGDYGSSIFAGLGAVMTIFYVGFAILYFFPCLFLLRFSNHMRNALNTNDQVTLNSSFQNLKIMFRYVGILTIIVISLYILLFLFGILTTMSGM